MILSQFYIYGRDDTINLNFEYGYKCRDFMENIVSSWKYDSIKKSMEFIIRDYKFVVTESNELVSVTVSSPSGLLTVIPLKPAFEFCVDRDCVMVCCGYEVHRYYSYV